ncbi:hypothetical protein DS885_01300 [Psychromonas sp. B3M02]|uniref:hypothetical protein n=1 Tax=Psychromonas sp. B3M02 TaxID=2267226 RepID=UPI000DE82BC8|nr:hypothetical protein [Psychromonas sp. B3M02]RBW47823.1 hypothetical protein DS885_01300 [Psychromonas sp. B3M02]
MTKTDYLISLDYELFFGKNTGSVEDCMITPTNQLLTVLNKYNSRVCLFVDAGFLVKLKEYAKNYPELQQQYNDIKQQLLSLSKAGHDIQLHIHPHWVDSTYDKNGWNIETRRYRLHDFSDLEIDQIVRTYKAELTSCTLQPIFAYRAGGWCLQPFDRLAKALASNGIWLDSTLFNQGYSSDPTRYFDFTDMPQQAYWTFSTDPLQPDPKGQFLEIPISAFRTSPWFFWKLAFHKKLSSKQFKSFGNGQAMVANKQYYIDRLTKATFGPVMIDGAKAGQLESALRAHNKQQPNAIFNIMGHPKSLAPYSLTKLDQFLNNHPQLQCKTFQNFRHLMPSMASNI